VVKSFNLEFTNRPDEQRSKSSGGSSESSSSLGSSGEPAFFGVEPPFGEVEEPEVEGLGGGVALSHAETRDPIDHHVIATSRIGKPLCE
jgi:hypothetical protein